MSPELCNLGIPSEILPLTECWNDAEIVDRLVDTHVDIFFIAVNILICLLLENVVQELLPHET